MFFMLRLKTLRPTSYHVPSQDPDHFVLHVPVYSIFLFVMHSPVSAAKTREQNLFSSESD